MNGLCLVLKEDGHMTYIDETGKEVITEYEISMANNFSEGLASIEKTGSNNYCYIDKTGKVVIDNLEQGYNYYGFSEGLARVSIGKDGNEKYGFIDKTGKIVIGKF